MRAVASAGVRILGTVVLLPGRGAGEWKKERKRFLRLVGRHDRSRDPETATVSILVEHLVQGRRWRSGQKWARLPSVRNAQAAVRAEKKPPEEKIREDFLEEVMLKPRPKERAGAAGELGLRVGICQAGRYGGDNKANAKAPAGQAQRIVQRTQKRA